MDTRKHEKHHVVPAFETECGFSEKHKTIIWPEDTQIWLYREVSTTCLPLLPAQ